MPIPNEKRLHFRTLDVKEWLIGMNATFDLFFKDKGFFHPKREGKRRFFTFSDFRAVIACKVLQDSVGFIHGGGLGRVLNHKGLSATPTTTLIRRLVDAGWLQFDGQFKNIKKYTLTEKAYFFLTRTYPKLWLEEYRRLQDLRINMRSIKHVERRKPYYTRKRRNADKSES